MNRKSWPAIVSSCTRCCTRAASIMLRSSLSTLHSAITSAITVTLPSTSARATGFEPIVATIEATCGPQTWAEQETRSAHTDVDLLICDPHVILLAVRRPP